jgi:hypothetical protein
MAESPSIAWATGRVDPSPAMVVSERDIDPVHLLAGVRGTVPGCPALASPSDRLYRAQCVATLSTGHPMDERVDVIVERVSLNAMKLD